MTESNDKFTEALRASSRRPRSTHAEAPAFKHVGANLNPEFAQQLKIMSAEESVPMRELMVEALNMLFKSRGKPEIVQDPPGD
ncbi:MAG: hypothetical protein F4213_05660 [Boseongicola sp. SB0677_bin_26]|nr:hypothetical protein [Boseongicola sp. SB0665_bin_10]MYG25493.1 hypothetical protein [Boseongicola sp. SB0677_bin_26]